MSIQGAPRRRFFTEGCLGHVLVAVILLAVPAVVWVAAGGWWPS